MPTNWYDGALAGFAVDLPAFRGACRFECVASYDDHNGRCERIFVIAQAMDEDIREATKLAEESVGGMMYYPPEQPGANAAVNALMQRTARALADSNALLLFALDVAGAEGLARAVGPDVDRVEQALRREHTWHGDPDDWEDLRATATPIAPSTP